MKRIYYILVGVVCILLMGCTENEQLGGEGTLRMKVNVDQNVKASARGLTDDEQTELKNNCEIRIYSGKGLVRYYKGISQMPEELQLATGSYRVQVVAGDSVPASFDKTYYKGADAFEIKAGSVTSQTVKCKIANVLVTANFDKSLDEVFESYKITVFTKNGELEFTKENKDAIGYYMLAKEESSFQWEFEGIMLTGQKYTKSEVVEAKPTTRYDLNFKFSTDFEDGGASLQVKVDTTPLETIEDEIIFYQRPSFRGVGFDITTPYICALNAANELSFKIAVTSALMDATLSCEQLMEWGFDANTLQLVTLTDEERVALEMNGLKLTSAFEEETGAGILTVTLTSTLVQKITTTEKNFTFTLFALDANDKSNTGVLTVLVSDASVLTKEVHIADVWTSKTILRGELIHETLDPLNFNYRIKGTANWTNVEAVRNGEEISFTAELTDLQPGTEYEYQALAGNTPSALICTFSTEKAAQFPNGGFERWSGDLPLLIYGEGEDIFWDSGNKGSATMKKNVTTSIARDGLNGGKRAAQLKSQFVGLGGGLIGKFAAGNLFTGEFLGTEEVTQGILSFGREFTSRPSELSVWYRATVGTIDYSETNMAPTGTPDMAIVYIALGDWKAPLEVHTKDKNTLFSKDDPNIIAYGELVIDKNVNDWTNHKIKLEYRSLSRKPTYIITVASASKYGDYYTGSTGSVLWLDDLELIYE